MDNNENKTPEIEIKDFKIDDSVFEKSEEVTGETEQPREDDIVKIIKKEEKAERRKRKLRKRIIKNIIWMIVIVLLSVSLATVVIVGAGEYFGIGPGRGRDVTVEIEPGMSTREIAEALKASGAINSSTAFRIYSRITGNDGKYSYGVYTFTNELGYDELCDMLMTQGKKADSVTVTIPEMASIDDMAALLEENGVCTAKDFKYAVNYGEFKNDIIKDIPVDNVYYRLEGYLFPDTYDFYCYDSEECAVLAVQKMLDKMEKEFGKGMIERAEEMDYSVHEILTLASIVELEAGGSPDEMANVAQVFYNRLNNSSFTTLGSSPTIKYPYGNGKYNTYECVGLPVGPLCAPSLNSIKAALYPNEKQTATYFVTDKSMNFYYNDSLSDHNATIAKLQRENNWIYEYFE